MMVKNSNEDGIFLYYQGEELVTTFFLSFWSIVTCCVKVAQLVQSLVAKWFVHSIKHLSHIPQEKIVPNPPKFHGALILN
jgi:hypothetical protein